jgi:glycosyltransferase involved in cell wall biosynthesis
MKRPIAFLLSGDPEARTGGTLYDRRIVDELRVLGHSVTLHRLGDGFPFPDTQERAEAASVLAAIPGGTAAVVDGLAFGALPDEAAEAGRRLSLAALVHHPLALESGLDAAQQAALFASEREALSAAHGIIVTSAATVRDLAPYGVAAERATVILPGTDPAPLAHGSGGSAPVLLCVATLTPRKGHLVLIEALAGLADLPWSLVCAGSTSRDVATADAIRSAVARAGLGDRVAFPGEVGRAALDALYNRADLFVLPSWHEGYGMALAEAVARGLPVVSTRAGAIPDTVPHNAGLLVAPGDAAALSAVLRRLLVDPAERANLAAGARAARGTLPGWPAQGRRFSSVVDALP